ncbi:MAG TPA: SLATT domain-containing protein [Thermoanaerobaculia bacterium]|nr:SLATT domain-containing protein [Thermoanaerobaculia bacterium]
MPQKESLEYLEEQLAAQIASFDSSRQYFRTQQFRFTMATAVLSSATTILIAAEKIIDFKLLSLVALVCSAAITVVAAYDQFLRSRDLWVQKTDAWMELKNLEANMNYSKIRTAELTQEEIDKFYDRFDRILMGEHEAWKKVRAAQGPKPPSRSKGKRA